MTLTYVYGVASTDATVALPTDGVGQAAPRLLVYGRLTAIVGSLPEEELRVRRRDLTAHLEVLRAVHADATVVPCRFCTIFDSDDAVRDELLHARGEELLALLDQLEGRAQYVLSARYDEDALLREIVADEDEIAALRGVGGYAEQLRLGELVSTAREARRERDGQAIVSRLEPLADAVVTDDPGSQRALRASFLVANDSAAAFERAVESLADDGGGRILYELIGPLPPTAFVELAETEAAWA